MCYLMKYIQDASEPYLVMGSSLQTVFVQQVFDKLFSFSTRQAPEPRGGWRGGGGCVCARFDFLLSLSIQTNLELTCK